jgi:Fe-S-cluster containining protein
MPRLAEPRPAAWPLPSDPPTPEQVAAEVRRLSALLSKRNRERLREAVRDLARRLERATADHPPGAPVACRAGCTHCCHLYVSATAPELFALAERVRSWPAVRQQAFQARLDAAHGLAAGKGLEERAALALPCPVLGEDGLCAAYDARPLTCRAYASFDLDACAAAKGQAAPPRPIRVPRTPMRMRRFLLHCFRAALAERGMDAGSYELVAGLKAVLDTERAEARWLAGEDVLAAARG